MLQVQISSRPSVDPEADEEDDNLLESFRIMMLHFIQRGLSMSVKVEATSFGIERRTLPEIAIHKALLKDIPTIFADGPGPVDVTDTMTRIRGALVAALDYAREMEVATCIDRFEEALALLDQRVLGWQLPDDQLDGGFDREWMELVMGVKFVDWPLVYLTEKLSFCPRNGHVIVNDALQGNRVFTIAIMQDREQFIHLLSALQLTAFPKNPECREIAQDEKVIMSGAEVVGRHQLFQPLKERPAVIGTTLIFPAEESAERSEVWGPAIGIPTIGERWPGE